MPIAFASLVTTTRATFAAMTAAAEKSSRVISPTGTAERNALADTVTGGLAE